MRQNDKYPHNNWITYFVACQKFWIANYIKDIARSSLSLSSIRKIFFASNRKCSKNQTDSDSLTDSELAS